MQYKANSPKEYLEKLEDDWRKDQVEKVRDMIMHVWPEAKENIEYSMLCYGDGSKNIFHLNAQKGYVAFYVGYIDKVGDSHQLLEGFDLGKGCIRIRKTLDISNTGLSEFISRAVMIHRAGGNTDC